MPSTATSEAIYEGVGIYSVKIEADYVRSISAMSSVDSLIQLVASLLVLTSQVVLVDVRELRQFQPVLAHGLHAIHNLLRVLGDLPGVMQAVALDQQPAKFKS